MGVGEDGCEPVCVLMQAYAHVCVLSSSRSSLWHERRKCVADVLSLSRTLSKMGTRERGHTSPSLLAITGLFDVLPVLVNLRAALSPAREDQGG